MTIANLYAALASNDAEIAGYYAGRRVLVTGADGFLGYNATLALLALGAEVTILTRRPGARILQEPGAAEKIRIFTGDLRHGDIVAQAVAGQEVVLDLAGISGAVRSNQNPIESLDVDCGPHLRLYQTCIETCRPLPRVLFCSTRLVYGRPRTLPVDENHPLCPDSIYAAHKISIENYLRVFGHLHGLPYCVVRLTNPYGPFQPLQTSTHGIMNLFLKLAAEREPIRLFGDGSQRRDFVYVTDVITMFLRMVMTPACHGEFFNLGGHTTYSLREVAEQIAELAGGTPVVYTPWPKNFKEIETGDFQSDMSKLAARIRMPDPTPIARGIEQTLAYYRQAVSAQTPHVTV